MTISKDDFKAILAEAVPSTFKHEQFKDIQAWKQALKSKDVRLQWDPDHSPYGGKLERKAIQLGLKGEVLNAFGTQYVQKIEDITDFVTQQHAFVIRRNLDALQVPVETILEIKEDDIKTIINLT